MSVSCTVCSADLQEGQAILFQGKKNSPNVAVCANCADGMERAIKAESESPNLASGLAAGLLAALIASLIWFGVVVITEYQLGLVAIAIGWLVAQAVMFGAGRKRGAPLQLTSVGITLAAMATSEYFIVRHFIVEAIKAEGHTGFPLFLPPADMVDVIVEGIKIEPMTLLFWALALWVAYRQPAVRRLTRISPWSTTSSEERF